MLCSVCNTEQNVRHRDEYVDTHNLPMTIQDIEQRYELGYNSDDHITEYQDDSELINFCLDCARPYQVNNVCFDEEGMLSKECINALFETLKLKLVHVSHYEKYMNPYGKSIQLAFRGSIRLENLIEKVGNINVEEIERIVNELNAEHNKDNVEAGIFNSIYAYQSDEFGDVAKRTFSELKDKIEDHYLFKYVYIEREVKVNQETKKNPYHLIRFVYIFNCSPNEVKPDYIKFQEEKEFEELVKELPSM